MGHKRNWRGYAEFELPEGQREVLMTVCPGNPEQEGRRFRAIMEAAGNKLDRLYIIEAGDLGYHNLKRLVPKSEAQAFARHRGERWVEAHLPAIEEYMKGRCEIIPMRDVVADETYQERIALIKAMYEQGNNPVADWFNQSIDVNVANLGERKAKDGVIIEPWAIKESALDYLCDEYAMRSLMWQKFGLEEIYLGRSITDSELFQRENTNPYIDLTIPKVRPIDLKKMDMVQVRKLGAAVPANNQQIPSHTKNFGMSLK
jgi:hypothetical protein